MKKNRFPNKKNGFSGRIPNFWGKKKKPLFSANHVPATTGQSCQKKKYPFPPFSQFPKFFLEKNGFSAKRKNVNPKHLLSTCTRCFLPLPECAEKDTIPVLRVIEKLKKVKTVSDCAKKCIQNPDCDFYKWKVTQTQLQFILSLI